MLDWWSGQVASDASRLDTGTKIWVAPGGIEEYSTTRWAQAQGSYTATIEIRARPPKPDLPTTFPLVYEISGNLSKFLQGHNCFGPPASQLDEVVKAVMQNLPLNYRPTMVQPCLHTSRIDVTTMINMGSQHEVDEWLAHAGRHTRSRQGRPLTAGSTVMWGSKTRWQIVAYNKLRELHQHPPSLLDFRPQIDDYIAPMLRLELRLHRKEIVRLAEAQTPITEELIWTYFERVEIGIMKNGGMPAIDQLPDSSRQIAQLWLDGHPVRHQMKRSKFYYHRRRILDETGLDISLEPDSALDGYPRVNLAQEYLRAKEVQHIPEVFNKWLWRPPEPIDYKIAPN